MSKCGYELFADFEQQKEIFDEDIPLLIDYIYHLLNMGIE